MQRFTYWLPLLGHTHTFEIEIYKERKSNRYTGRSSLAQEIVLEELKEREKAHENLVTEEGNPGIYCQ